MNRALIKKCLRDARWLWLASAAALFAFCWLRVWIVSRLDMDRFQKILELLPDQWQRYSPVPLEELLSYTGRISITYDEPLVVMIVSIWGIARGSDCVSGELNRGTMELLLAQPLSRLQIACTQSAVTILGGAALAAACYLGTWIGIETTSIREKAPAFKAPLVGWDVYLPFSQPKMVEIPMREKTSPSHYLPAAINLFSLGFFLAGLSFLASSWDRYRWRTIGLVVGFYVVSVILKIAGMSAEELSWMKSLSIFSAYEPELLVYVAFRQPEASWHFLISAEGGAWRFGPASYYAILLSLGSLAYLLGGLIFLRRDLPAPL